MKDTFRLTYKRKITNAFEIEDFPFQRIDWCSAIVRAGRSLDGRMVGNGEGKIKGQWNLKTPEEELVRYNIRRTSKTGEIEIMKILSVVKCKIGPVLSHSLFFRSTVKIQTFSININ